MNTQKVANKITNWIADQAYFAHASSLVVGVSGGVDSAVVLALCMRTGYQTIGVVMPCHSTPSAMDRAHEVCDKFRSTRFKIDLSQIHDNIVHQVRSFPYVPEIGKDATGALSSCLRAPVLDFVAKFSKGIIVGTGNRDEDEVTRYFQKRGDGAVDISPIAKLHKDEVYELAEYLGVPKSVIEATPSADLWGPDGGQTDEGQLGMTYPEISEAIRTAGLFSKTGDVTCENLMQAANAEQNPRLAQVMRELAQMEISSRHKANPNLPVCPITDEDRAQDYPYIGLGCK